MRVLLVLAILAAVVIATWKFAGDSAQRPLLDTPAVPAPLAVKTGAVAAEPALTIPEAATRTAASDGRPVIHVRGRVVGVDGQPVTRGVIIAQSLEEDPRTLCFPKETDAHLENAGSGRFELDLDGPSELTVTTGDPSQRTIVSALVQSREATAEEFEIVVAPTVRVRGVVAREDGEGMYGASVRVRMPTGVVGRLTGSDPGRRRLAGAELHVCTEENGTFELTVPRVPGTLLELWDEDEHIATQSLPNQDADDLRFVVPTETLRGVLLRPDGSPIVGANVDSHGEHVVSDAHGRFAFAPGWRVLTNQALRICEPGARCITFENFGRRWIDRDPAVVFRVVCDGLQHEIRGTLVNADGSPAAGWRVDVTKRPRQDAQKEDVFRDTFPNGARTNSDGTFVLAHLARGEHELLFRSPDYEVGFRRAGIASGSSGVSVRVADDAVIPVLRGRVLTTAGVPVPGMGLSFDVDSYGDCVVNIGRKRAMSDADGWFEVRDISRQATVVQAARHFGQFMPYEREPLVVEPGDRATIWLDECASVTFERRRFDVESDRIVVFDSKDAQLRCWIRSTDEGSPFRYGSDAFCHPIERDRSPSFDVGVSAAWIAVLSPHGVVARVPLTLKPGVQNLLVWR